jgi:GGDEF domain-containing protein
VTAGGLRGPRDRQRSEVDPLTGFGARAALLRALEHVSADAAPPTLLAVFSLDGFDEYEALFGRLAGRTLIVKLAARLVEALPPDGARFRPRRDEFAALLAPGLEEATATLDAAVAGVRERATSVAVTSAWGAASVPDEVSDPLAALRLADRRLAATAGRRLRERRNREGRDG